MVGWGEGSGEGGGVLVRDGVGGGGDGGWCSG